MILILGGAASGKSAFAEDMCRRLDKGPKAYAATMAVQDAESGRRVEKHRGMRQGKNFVTVEHEVCSRYRPGIFSGYKTVLLECVSNLLANEMYIGQKTAAEAEAPILEYIARINSEVRYAVVVSNDIFGAGEVLAGRGGKQITDFTRDFLDGLGHLNRSLAEKAETVIEMVYGIPVFLKGRSPPSVP